MKRDLTALKAIIRADYKRHVKRFSELKAHKDIIFIGDSIVAYFPLKSFHLDTNIHNLGIPGDTTQGVMDRLDQVYPLNPKHILLQIGLNDEVLLKHSPEQTVNHIKEIVDTLYHELPQTNITIISLTPINQTHFPHGTYVIDRQPEFSRAVNKKIQTFGHVHYLNLYDQLLDHSGELDEHLTTDGIHLNHKGYTIYANILKNVL